jgi:hypothetical protein
MRGKALLARILQIAIPFIWVGALASISFMETPLKFTAPDVTLPLGLGIGRVVFQMLNHVEVALAVLMTFAIYFRRPKMKLPLALFGVVMLLLIMQTIWLLPVLGMRTDMIVAGQTPPPSSLHVIYIIFDAVKLILLFATGSVLIAANLQKK